MPSLLRPSRIYLTGFMGSGKSTVAWALAHRLGWTYVDLDRLIEVLTRRSVADHFAEGEAAFRSAEQATLARTFDRERIVVATGGGALVAPGAMEAARAVGHVVYLRLNPEALAARLEADATPRPLLTGPTGRLQGTALQTRVAALLAERGPWYAQADLTVEADGLSPDAVAVAVEAALAGSSG